MTIRASIVREDPGRSAMAIRGGFQNRHLQEPSSDDIGNR